MCLGIGLRVQGVGIRVYGLSMYLVAEFISSQECTLSVL